jgi:hypothetical protein
MMNNDQSCAKLHLDSDDKPDRVSIINDVKPECACELESMSELSVGVIKNDEIITRMICSPMHIHTKRLELKSNFFSYIANRGASAQRLNHATDEELAKCVSDLTGSDTKRAWVGFVCASAEAIRQIRTVGETPRQALCVFDAALEGNPAHAEIHCSGQTSEADQIAYRHELMKVFKAESIAGRRELNGGRVWALLPNEVRQRALPDHCAGIG